MPASGPTLLAVALALPALAQETGTMPHWEVEELSRDVIGNLETASRVVTELQPADWVRDGAPADYVDQRATLLEEMEHARLSALALGREPESITYAVDAFLWLDRVDALLASVTAGARRYYNSAVADLLDSVRNRNRDGIATVRGYMRDLAVYVEAELGVTHQEAQRCRAQVAAQPLGR